MSKPKQTLFDKIRNEGESKQTLVMHNFRDSNVVRFLIVGISVMICTFFFIFRIDEQSVDSSEFRFEPGYTWTNKPIFAEFSFPVYKSATTYERELRNAENNSLPVFVHKQDAESFLIKEIDKLFSGIKTNRNNSLFASSVFELVEKVPISGQNDSKIKIKNEITNFIKYAYNSGVLDLDFENIRTKEIIAFNPPNFQSILKKDLMLDNKLFNEKGKNYFDSKLKTDASALAKEVLNSIKYPNLVFNKDLTEQEKELNKKSVARSFGIVKKGDMLVKHGDRVNDVTALKLHSYQIARNQQSENNTNFLRYLGSMGHVCLIFSFILIYLYNIRKKIFNDNFQFGILCSILVLTSILSWLSIEIPSEYPIEYLIFLPAFSMLTAIVYDSRTGFYATVTMSLMIAGIRGNDYTTAIVMLFSGTLAAYTVRDIQNRTQMFRSIFYIFIGFLLPILIFGFERSSSWNIIIQKISLTVVNAILSPLLTFGLLFIIDRSTNFATDLRLEEFDNLDHPLLVKLRELAPGTYQHSLSLAMLSERCASAVNGNHTFVKVAAYFHDIGKIERSEYFGENQLDNMGNKHDLISPKKSASIIIDHVPFGAELAREHKLPERIIDIIFMHHGTTLVKHFYAKAVEQVNGEYVNEEDFKYPGPKPNSKEAAILMICDTAEAISRLGNKTKEQLDEMVDTIIKDKFNEGQFDDCDITTGELKIVADTLSKTLNGIHHQRMEYKTIAKAK